MGHKMGTSGLWIVQSVLSKLGYGSSFHGGAHPKSQQLPPSERPCRPRGLLSSELSEISLLV